MVCSLLLSEKKKKRGKCRGHFLLKHVLSLGNKVSPALYATDTSSWVAFFAGFQFYTGIALLFIHITVYKQPLPSLHRIGTLTTDRIGH